VINPAQTVSWEFTADGTSDFGEFDASVLPLGLNFAGTGSIVVLLPSVTSAYTGPLSGVGATISNTTITLSFQTAPPKVDNNGNLIIYTATVVLQYGV
jgi:hypothetical protein